MEISQDNPEIMKRRRAANAKNTLEKNGCNPASPSAGAGRGRGAAGAQTGERRWRRRRLASSSESPPTHLQVGRASEAPSQHRVNTAICFSISGLIKVKRDESIICGGGWGGGWGGSSNVSAEKRCSNRNRSAEPVFTANSSKR